MIEPRRASAAELAAIAGRVAEDLRALPERDCACRQCDVVYLLAHIAALEAERAACAADLHAAVAELAALHGEVERLRG